MIITPPKTSSDHADHVLDCEFVLGPYFQELAEKAAEAGWDEDVVAAALVGLAEARVEMRKANVATDSAVIRARAKRQQ